MWRLVPVRGVFCQVTGNGTVSAAGDVTGTITVAARSVHTKNKRRDEHLPGRNVVCQILAARRHRFDDNGAQALGGRVDVGRQAGRPRSDDRQVVFRPGWSRDHAETLGDLFHRRSCQPRPVREDAQRQRRWLYFGDSQDRPHRLGPASVDSLERVTVAAEEITDRVRAA